MVSARGLQMADTTQGPGLDEFALEIDTPRSGELADFEPELSADAPDTAFALSRVLEDPGRQQSSREPAHLLRRAQPLPTDERNNTIGPVHPRYGRGAPVVAACVGIVIVAGLAGYLLQRAPPRAVQLPSVAIERNDLSVPPANALG